MSPILYSPLPLTPPPFFQAGDSLLLAQAVPPWPRSCLHVAYRVCQPDSMNTVPCMRRKHRGKKPASWQLINKY